MEDGSVAGAALWRKRIGAVDAGSYQIDEGRSLASEWQAGTPLPTASKTGKEAFKRTTAVNPSR